MSAETDLLPCPWCGEKLASVSVSEGSTFRWRKVDGCCADGPEVRHNTMAEDQEAAEVESRAAAIAAWNTRANVAHATAPLQAEIDALRAEVERANGWNERVSVCRDHVADIVDGPCVICALDAAEARAERLAEALRLALNSRGKTLLTDPPQDAWKVNRVEEIGRALLREQEEGNGQ